MKVPYTSDRCPNPRTTERIVALYYGERRCEREESVPRAYMPRLYAGFSSRAGNLQGLGSGGVGHGSACPGNAQACKREHQRTFTEAVMKVDRSHREFRRKKKIRSI